MRYYDIRVLNTDGTPFILNGAAVRWASMANGQFDPGALLVELDLPVTQADTPISAAAVKVWGVDLRLRGQASDCNGKILVVYGGMFKGLPLATLAYNSGQSGLLLTGLITQAFGNSIGINQWIEFIVTANANDVVGQQLNLSFTWTKGTPLANAIQHTLAVAAPTLSTVINITSNIVLPEDEHGVYENIFQFASYLRQMSMSVVKTPAYQGVGVVVTPNSFVVSDGTTAKTPKNILFTDLVGQPTWIGPQIIQLTVYMRADLDIYDKIKLPITQITAAPQDPLQPLKDKSIFQGSFGISSIRHVGNSRQADALAWITVLEAYPATS